MGIVSLTVDRPAQIGGLIGGVAPRKPAMVTTDSLATITAAGYLNPALKIEAQSLVPTDVIDVIYSYSASSNSGTYGQFTVGISNGVITLTAWVNPGDVLLPTVANDIAVFANSSGQIMDGGPANTSTTTSSATPGTIRALKGVINGTATTMTTGNLVGARGEADVVGASGGFIYGVQGKVIPTGTLSGSSWTAGVFAQFDLSHPAVINGGQLAAVWGDWGATGGTATDLSGCRGFAFTNTTANVLNSQDYRYGNATYLLELAGAGGTLNYYLSAGTSAGSAGDASHCAAQQVIKIEINGVAAYIPVFTQNT